MKEEETSENPPKTPENQKIKIKKKVKKSPKKNIKFFFCLDKNNFERTTQTVREKKKKSNEG